MAARGSEPESELLKAFKEIFVEGNRAWNEGDFRRAYGALPEDFEYQLGAHWPEHRVLHGPDEVVAFFEEAHEMFPDTQSTGLQFTQVDERTVIVGFEWRGTGARSGATTAMEIWQVWEMREGLVPSRVREYPNRAAALEAAGTADPAAPQGGE